MAESILVTGANGFVGSALVQTLRERGVYKTKVAVRSNSSLSKVLAADSSVFQIGNINGKTDWRVALKGVNVVVHAAGRAHIMGEVTADSDREFDIVNVDGTLRLADQAAQLGVKRFIFLSTIGVNGAETITAPYSEASKVDPYSAYALSKWKAEEGLRLLSKKMGIEVVIVRPPMIYGRGAPGNFNKMLQLLSRRVPMPFGSIDNRKSLVALPNLIDFVMTCMKHPNAADQTFLVSDDEDMSTTEMLRRTGEAMGIPARLFPFPVCLMTIAMSVLGKKAMARQLFGSLQVDISKARNLLGWKPPVSVEVGLRQAAGDYVSRETR